MDFLKAIPQAFYAIFRFIVKVSLFLGVLFLLGIPAFLLSFIPQLVFGWGPGPSLGLMYGIAILTYIGYRMSKQ
jgi:hypothetical protein